MTKNDKTLIKKLNKKYTTNFDIHGDSPASVGWSSGKMNERFDLLFKGLRDYHSILDIGCGLGYLFKYLNNNNNNKDIQYSGTEINPAFYDFCKKSYKNCNFYLQKDLTPSIDKKFDVVVMCGLLNTNIDNSTLPYDKIIDAAFKLSRKYITFNFLSKDVDFQDDHLNYSSLGAIVEYCESRSKEIIIKKSSLLHEVTLSILVKND